MWPTLNYFEWKVAIIRNIHKNVNTFLLEEVELARV